MIWGYDIMIEEKLKKYFSDTIVFKAPEQSRFFSALSLPSFLRDWLVMRFADESGRVDKEEVSRYINTYVPRKEQWEQLKHTMTHEGLNVKFLARVRVEIDIATREALFSLPDFGFPQRKKEAMVEDRVLMEYKEQLLSSSETWGVVELACFNEDDGKSRIHMVGFTPFCPYRVDLEYFQEARRYFTIDEWIDVLLMAMDYNPMGFLNKLQKTTMLSRLLPFVEKRMNIIELAPKGTGKSYVFSQISKYGWLVSGGSITRARLFYDINKKSNGLVSYYDYVALDEIQSIVFANPEEVQGALKGYLESGEFRVGDHEGVGSAGFVLLGNIDSNLMNVDVNMFQQLPLIFHESALLDRFHGFIKGWDIPRVKENMEANGWALNVEYFSEIMHLLRDDIIYRAVVDEVLDVPKSADHRDTEAIKRICTGFLKLFFPNVRDASDIDANEFIEYCLKPAMHMRGVIKKQLAIIDPGDFAGKDIPDITCRLAKE
jgi:ATP-dependent Lon protease